MIPCFRCGKKLEHPDASNSDYIMAADTVVTEPCEILYAVKHNALTLDKLAKMTEFDQDGKPKYPGMTVLDSDYDEVELPNIQAAKLVDQLVRVKSQVEDRAIQKTGIICPDCYRDSDFLIWGIHKP